VFQIFPAIDLLEGRAVRLVKGKRETAETVGEPLALVERFARAPLLHVVDLDGAFAGGPRQHALIGQIAQRHAVQAGGGVRSLDDIDRLLQAGVQRVVVGTAFVENPDLLDAALSRFGAERLVVAVDVKDGRVAVAGWAGTAAHTPRAFATLLAERGARHVLCTAVHRDGTLEGPDTAVLDDVSVPGLSIIASGGIGSLDDVRAVRRFAGVVVGKALYAGRFSLDEALDEALAAAEGA
jgi:phosphoribosylformimino-5-aminoimidazole carboxamide ribotide isomerase